MKWIGALFIIFSTTWLGFYFAGRLSERTKELRAWKLALQSLEAEVMYSQLPLQEASKRIANQLSGPINTFLHDFANQLETSALSAKEAWKSSLTNYAKTVSIKESDLQVLLQFGETIGMHDKYSQQKQIILALKHLEREEQEAIDSQGNYERMSKMLGILSGILIVILLL
jgi:stage III sporulation protein AB